MGRPKKSATELAQDSSIASAIDTLEEGAQAQDNVQISENELPVTFAEGTEKYLEYDGVSNSGIIDSPGVELRKGRIVVDTGITLDPDVSALIIPYEDNAQNGLLIENGGRCMHSDVISQFVRGGQRIKVVINVNDDVMVTEQGAFGSRVRFATIPAETPLAQIVFL